MKTVLSFLLLLTILSFSALSQTPLAIPYQAVARTASGNLISNQLISVRFTIHDGSASGDVLYKEKHTPTTNAVGLFNINFGTGTIISGTMESINWGINSKFLQVELDTAGGNNFIDMGTTQMMSVPYALHAKTAESISGGRTHLILTGDVTDEQADSIIANHVGPNTQFVKVYNTTNLTRLDLSKCIELVKLEFSYNYVLSSINLSNITTIHESAIFDTFYILSSIALPSLHSLNCELTVHDNPNLDSFELGSLRTLNSTLTIYNNRLLSTLNLGCIQTISSSGSIITFTNLNGNDKGIAYSVNLSNLTTLAGILDFTWSNIKAIDFNNLTTLETGSVIRIKESELSLINFNSLNSVKNSTLDIANNLNLNSINFPAITSIRENSQFILEQNAFTSSIVNNLLAQFVSASFSDYSRLIIYGQNPPAPPTGQGIIDKNTLISNGNIVETDN